jgi:hypothetical protein
MELIRFTVIFDDDNKIRFYEISFSSNYFEKIIHFIKTKKELDDKDIIIKAPYLPVFIYKLGSLYKVTELLQANSKKIIITNKLFLQESIKVLRYNSTINTIIIFLIPSTEETIKLMIKLINNLPETIEYIICTDKVISKIKFNNLPLGLKKFIVIDYTENKNQIKLPFGCELLIGEKPN